MSAYAQVRVDPCALYLIYIMKSHLFDDLLIAQTSCAAQRVYGPQGENSATNLESAVVQLWKLGAAVKWPVPDMAEADSPRMAPMHVCDTVLVL